MRDTRRSYTDDEVDQLCDDVSRVATEQERAACAAVAEKHIKRRKRKTEPMPESGWQVACVAIKAAILARS